MRAADEGKDIETRVRELLADFRSKGIDCVLALQYLDGRDKAFVIKHTPNLVNCRKLTRMVWQSVNTEVPGSKKPDWSPPDDDD